MDGHGQLHDILIGVNHLHARVHSADFLEFGLFKLDAHGKVKRCLGEGHHLLRFGFIGVWVGTGLYHHLHIDPILANLLHEVTLGGNADEDLNRFGCPCIGYESIKI